MLLWLASMLLSQLLCPALGRTSGWWLWTGPACFSFRLCQGWTRSRSSAGDCWNSTALKSCHLASSGCHCKRWEFQERHYRFCGVCFHSVTMLIHCIFVGGFYFFSTHKKHVNLLENHSLRRLYLAQFKRFWSQSEIFLIIISTGFSDELGFPGAMGVCSTVPTVTTYGIEHLCCVGLHHGGVQDALPAQSHQTPRLLLQLHSCEYPWRGLFHSPPPTFRDNHVCCLAIVWHLYHRLWYHLTAQAWTITPSWGGSWWSCSTAPSSTGSLWTPSTGGEPCVNVRAVSSPVSRYSNTPVFSCVTCHIWIPAYHGRF